MSVRVKSRRGATGGLFGLGVHKQSGVSGGGPGSVRQDEFEEEGQGDRASSCFLRKRCCPPTLCGTKGPVLGVQ